MYKKLFQSLIDALIFFSVLKDTQMYLHEFIPNLSGLMNKLTTKARIYDLGFLFYGERYKVKGSTITMNKYIVYNKLFNILNCY